MTAEIRPLSYRPPELPVGAVAALYARAPSADSAELDPVVAALQDWGPDGQRWVWRDGHAALAEQLFLTVFDTPSEPPPPAADLPLIAFDGRIDGREELAASLGAVAAHSDRMLVALALRRWELAAFDRLIGDFALCAYDPRSRRLTCARDRLGSRPLYWAETARSAVFATSPAALLKHPEVSGELDQARIACHFALHSPPGAATAYRAIREVLPGEVLVLTPSGTRSHQSGWPAVASPPRGDDEAAHEVFALLQASVRDRLRARGSCTVSLSGGVDSTAVAAAARQATDQLRGVSWGFEQLPEVDETSAVDQVASALGLAVDRVPCDDAWPLQLCDYQDVDSGAFQMSLYRHLKRKTYAAVSRRGLRTVLTGLYSDELFEDGRSWLASAISRGRWLFVAQQVASQFGHHRTLGKTARALAANIGVPRPSALRRPAWLSPAAWRAARAVSLGRCNDWLLGGWASKSALAEDRWLHRLRLDLRHPFRDLRLVSFVRALPPDSIRTARVPKQLLRRAVAGRLPPAITAAPRRGRLNALYRRGASRETDAIRQLLARPSELTRWLIEPHWLAGARPGELPNELQEFMLWQCVCLELWPPTGESWAPGAGSLAAL